MLYSMTGFGEARALVEGYQVLAEVKALNSRSTDIRVRLPSSFRELEGEIRKMTQEIIIRGKVDFTLSLEGTAADESYVINSQAIKDYYKQLSEIAKVEKMPFPDPMSAIVQLPNIYTASQLSLTDQGRQAILDLCRSSLMHLKDYRLKEGNSTAAFLSDQVTKIEECRLKAIELDPQRIDRIKTRILKNLQEIEKEIEVDQNRLEQELVYYLEKIDYTEETQRLEYHCSYFHEVLNETDATKGRKLNFISQEMGREINTLGSKAQNAEVQKVVVTMKDELEKIKEQLANIL